MPNNTAAYAEKWRLINRDKWRASCLRYRRKLKQDAINAYGKICACCGEERFEFLSIDHIGGGGNAHKRSLGLSAGGRQFYAWLRSSKYPPGFRVLCCNCNFSIGAYGYCPHQKEAECQRA